MWPGIDLRFGRWQEQLDGGPCRLADGSVRLLLFSPPYNEQRTYEDTHKGPVDFGELARFSQRVLCPGGVLAMVLDAEIKGGEQNLTPYETLVSWAKMPGWRFRQFLVYGRHGVPGNTPGMFRRDHEPLLIFVRDGAAPVWDKEPLVTRGDTGHVGRKSRNRAGAAGRGGGASRDPEALKRAHRGSIWWYGNVGYMVDPSSCTGHPATFSEGFAADAVRVWSRPGDLVCDPYSGSGTVAAVCRELGRRFVGAERVRNYFDDACARVG